MAANSKRRAQPHTLALEALEDRVLLSIATAKVILPQVDVNNQVAVGLAASPQPAVLHIDQQYGAGPSRITDWSLAEHWIDRTDSGYSEKRDGAPDELREHFANELARLNRSEGETVRILTEQPVLAAHESANQAQTQNGLECAYRFTSINAPAQVTVDAPALPLHSVSSINSPLEVEIPPLAALSYEESTPKDYVSDLEVQDPPSLVIAAANNDSGPVPIIPLLGGLQLSMPDVRQAVDEFLARLKDLRVSPSSCWSSLSFSAWVAAVAGAAVETARRMRATKGRRLPLLMANGWTLDGLLADEL